MTPPTRPAAILLAAGASSRLGAETEKQRLPYEGTTLLRHLAEELSAVASPLIVMLPESRRDFARELDGLEAEALVPPSMEAGLGVSLSSAARALLARRWSGGLLVALVDQPLADRELFASLEAAARAGNGWAASDYGEGAWGVPARFPASALSDLARLSGDRGAKALLEAQRARGELALVPFAGGRLDVDSPEDYARLLALSGDSDGGDDGSAG